MGNSDHMEIPMEESDPNWETRCTRRMEKQLEMWFSSSDSPAEIVVIKDTMSYELYNVVRDENHVDKFVDAIDEVCRRNELDCSIILNQVTPMGDSLLHVAAEYGREKIVELLVDHSLLLEATNSRRETPLHVAAKAKNIEVMKVILSRFQEAKKDDFIMSEDFFGNTALHDAILSKHREGVDFLISQQSVSSLPRYWDTFSAKSPIYLAFQTGDVKILRVLLHIPLPSHRLISGYQEISPLFAAIPERNAGICVYSEISQLICCFCVCFTLTQYVFTSLRVELLQEMVDTKEELMYLVDKYRNTPLHYAARIGYTEGVRILIRKSTLVAFRPNSNNDLPIHLACERGHVPVVDVMLDVEWPNTRFSLNNEGQNILHIAAMSGQNSVVKYLLRHYKIQRETVNERDRNGDTPLHLAARNLCLWNLILLSRDLNIDLNLVNNQGLTARDVVWMQAKVPMTRQEVRLISNDQLYLPFFKTFKRR